jgi:ADP-heptose:LPS heptosyltransferase
MPKEQILIIKLGALGDFLYALGPMQAIRKNHQNAYLTLLTRPAFLELGLRSNIFDEVIIDKEPKIWGLLGILQLRRALRLKKISRVYDLQTSDRTGFYYKLIGPGQRPEWSGIIPNNSLYHHYKRPTLIHTQERQREQLRIAGIREVLESDLSFMKENLDSFNLPKKFALIIPGSSPNMKIKRWPAEKYGELCQTLHQKDIIPIIIGSNDDLDAIKIITSACPDALNLAGQTTIFDIPSLGRKACLCVGNDTGPMHLIALTKCQTTAIFSTASFPEKAAPRGSHVRLLVRKDLKSLSVEEVISSLNIA